MKRSSLPARIADVLDDDRDASARARKLARARAPVRARPLRWVFALPPAVAALAVFFPLAVAALAVFFTFARPAPVVEPRPVEAAAEGLPAALLPGRQALGAGSWVELFPDAEATRMVDDASELMFLLQTGRIEFEIRPGGSRRVEIEAGLARVTVVGTHFAVEREEGRVRVEVSRGAVLVRGERVPDHARVVRAGESLVITDVAPMDEVEQAALVEGGAAGVPLALAPARAPARAAPSSQPEAPPPAGWRELASTGEYADAWEALGPAGVSAQLTEASAQDLLALADVARRSGHPAAAVEPLRALLARFPSDPDAAMGAFTLGRILLDALGRPREAAQAFERAIAGPLPGPIAADAWARLALARREAGDASAASEAARRYLADNPQGARAAEMRALIAR